MDSNNQKKPSNLPFNDEPDDDYLSRLENDENAPKLSSDYDSKDKELSPDELSDAENNSPEATSFVNRYTGGKKNNSKSKRKKLALGLLFGGGGGGLLIVLTMFLMLPYKLVAVSENINHNAQGLATHAIERRTEYLVLRALATQAIMQYTGKKADFCTKKSVACRIGEVYNKRWFEKNMGFDLSKKGGGVAIRTTVRSNFSKPGKEWIIDGRHLNRSSVTPELINQVRRTGEVERNTKHFVNNVYRNRNHHFRFIARWTLFSKFRIKNFSGLNKLDTNKSRFKARVSDKVYTNTVQKVSSRLGLYEACLSSKPACAKLQKLRDRKVARFISPPNSKDTPSRSDIKKKKRRIKRGIIIVDIADLLASAVDGIENGALDAIQNDIKKFSYVGYALGDETGMFTNAEKIKNGDIDMETLDVMMPMLDDLSESTLYQYENNIPVNTNPVDMCHVDDDEDGIPIYKKMNIGEGEVVCPEKRLNELTDSFGIFQSEGWGKVATVAHVWKATVGKYLIDPAYDLIGKGLSALAQIPGVKQVVDKAGKKLAEGVEWLMGKVMDKLFYIPPTGFDASGTDNYVALSGGARVNVSETTEFGQIPPTECPEEPPRNTCARTFDDIELVGMGGVLLDDKELSKIAYENTKNDLEYFHSQPFLARAFNPLLRGSLAQQALLSYPVTSPVGFASFVSKTIAGIFSPKVSAASVVNKNPNPFNINLHGFPVESSVYDTDSDRYTLKYCEDISFAREESFKTGSGYRVWSYKMADPCALERTVVGTLLASEGIEDDEHSFLSLDGEVYNKQMVGRAKRLGVPLSEVIGGGTGTGGGEGSSSGSTAPPPSGGGGVSPSGEWASPLPSGVRNSGVAYGATNINGIKHAGVDAGYSGYFYSICDGKVVGIDNNGEYNTFNSASGWRTTNHLTVSCGGGIWARYHHYYYRDVVPGLKVGSSVKAGDPLAKAGNQGYATGAHLHFEVRTSSSGNNFSDTKNPVSFLKSKGVNYYH